MGDGYSWSIFEQRCENPYRMSVEHMERAIKLLYAYAGMSRKRHKKRKRR